MSWNTHALCASSKTWPPSWGLQVPLPLLLSTGLPFSQGTAVVT